MVSIMENNLAFTMHGGNKEFGQGKGFLILFFKTLFKSLKKLFQS